MIDVLPLTVYPEEEGFDEYELLCRKFPCSEISSETWEKITKVLELSSIPYRVQIPNADEQLLNRAEARIYFKYEDYSVITGALLFCKAMCKDLSLAL